MKKCLLWVTLFSAFWGMAEEVRYNFEDGTSQGWTVEGGATFTKCVASTTKNLYAGNIEGTYAISTLYDGHDVAAGNDDLTGSVRSPNVTLTNGIVSFMMGGEPETVFILLRIKLTVLKLPDLSEQV